ncbi:unnamed protein product [Cuscuta epithymum]|uniref:Uncharacterized protein n=1 Tax=Cuscuta epithymum TaxID=186058 RepID=A0AAV0DP86_9ASTE|nr:unnamed protein product [Cuscuta epithymum]
MLARSCGKRGELSPSNCVAVQFSGEGGVVRFRREGGVVRFRSERGAVRFHREGVAVQFHREGEFFLIVLSFDFPFQRRTRTLQRQSRNHHQQIHPSVKIL